MRRLTTCRVCKQQEAERTMVKYGVRHYAHPECALGHFGAEFFAKLGDFPLSRFPVLVASKLGFLPALEAEIAKRAEINAQRAAEYAARATTKEQA